MVKGASKAIAIEVLAISGLSSSARTYGFVPLPPAPLPSSRTPSRACSPPRALAGPCARRAPVRVCSAFGAAPRARRPGFAGARVRPGALAGPRAAARAAALRAHRARGREPRELRGGAELGARAVPEEAPRGG